MSGLTFTYLGKEEPEMGDMVEVSERLCLTEPGEDGAQRVVPEGHPDARWLYAIPGQWITRADAERYGLLAAPEPEPEPAPEPPAPEKPAAKKPAAKSRARKKKG